MFEQSLTQDELGVAIRKISHSGKAQLCYVKCVPLRPPSSSDSGEDEDIRIVPLEAVLGVVAAASSPRVDQSMEDLEEEGIVAVVSTSMEDQDRVLHTSITPL